MGLIVGGFSGRIRVRGRCMPYRLRLGVTLVACLLSPHALAEQASAGSPDGGPLPVEALPDFHDAPSSVSANAPPEGELSPPPDSEKSQLPAGFVEILNPA